MSLGRQGLRARSPYCCLSRCDVDRSTLPLRTPRLRAPYAVCLPKGTNRYADIPSLWTSPPLPCFEQMLVPKKNRKEVYAFLFKGEWWDRAAWVPRPFWCQTGTRSSIGPRVRSRRLTLWLRPVFLFSQRVLCAARRTPAWPSTATLTCPTCRS